ncbi:cytochrome c oxidase accessory protein CcoG [Sandaracinobacter sp. RS1-74]|uniref:cytochrome c oxidase accessory protein CcoG n=1 Tax=Sandaracinobacteroides sayramensis TaxID=2913411 RepID=UPI001EDA5514|nr:cytochrome c oxidase accessory protein CcoG [Sandaracinobacteroides sayramensis]MCG2841447.1 cytochrome c oxidase accessory protein CcoG [Sandaracinobacteroides sayramensis]
MPGKTLLKPAPAAPPPPAGDGSLYKKRVKVHPKSVEGPFRRFKWIVLFLTLGVYYITPWLRWDRGEFSPDQAVLVDLANRRFYFGPIEIWPQEFYYVAGLLIMAGLGLFLITTTVGRAWCGYACPQTVWTDLYMQVERWIEGDRNARMRLDAAPMSAGKFAKRFSKHAVWLLIAVVTGGAWVFYFADAPTLLKQLLDGSAPFVAYGSIALLTFTTWSLAGLMREQVCTYMCPWPRIQSAMLDEDSFIVTYKGWRGEQRGSAKAKLAQPDSFGDCVDCMACVNVCPTGIDIRNGPQLECITCALCIDACNDVMAKLGRAPDLIGYTTLKRDEAESKGQPLEPMWKTLLRPRALVYFAVWAAIGIFMLVLLAGRSQMDISILQERNPIYVQLSDGDIRNSYTVKLLNKQGRPREFQLSVSGLEGALLSNPVTGEEPAKSLRLPVRADGVDSYRLQVRVPLRSIEAEQSEIRFEVQAVDGDGDLMKTARFTAPAR